MLFTVGGYEGNHPPVDPEGFTAFAAQLPAGLYEIIQQAEMVSDPVRFTFPVSVRNRYERLCTRQQGRFPDGLLVLGDAMCSFNPLYGQGMSVAALEALALRDCLRDGTRRLAARFFRAGARIVDGAWDISVTGDLQVPEVVGRRTLKGAPGQRLPPACARCRRGRWSCRCRVPAGIQPPRPATAPAEPHSGAAGAAR